MREDANIKARKRRNAERERRRRRQLLLYVFEFLVLFCLVVGFCFGFGHIKRKNTQQLSHGKAVDTENLERLIENLEEIDWSVYTSDTLADLSVCVNEAKEALKDPELTDAEVSRYYMELTNGIQNLQKK